MDFFSTVLQFILENVQYVLLIMTILIFISLLFFININIKLTRMNKRYRKLMTGMDGSNIERLLMGHIDEVREISRNMETMEEKLNQIDAMNKKSIYKIAMIRFNPFKGIGSDLSYAVAMLDHKNDGIIFSSLFGRDESRSYAKPIVNGQSSYPLTDEERQALEEAMKK